jgi:prepilin-type N-terminal cleavage/methylation domain-containing protein
VIAPTQSPLRDERGFTLIEILAAMLILLVGVFGTVSLIDGANATTSSTKGREGATNLGRELVESARSIDYDKLTQADIEGAMQAKPGLGDDDPGTAGWQIIRRGIAYTVTATASTIDDVTDNAGGDPNPDDYRSATFDVSWKDEHSQDRPRHVSLTGLMVNPSGGLGPRIISLDTTGASQTSVPFTVLTTSADTVHWSADDGTSEGNATGVSPTSWTFDWQLGTVGSFSCNAAPGWTLDGDYVVNAQAFDDRGVPGDLKSKTVTLDRSAPAPPCGLKGGRNDRFGIVDLEWLTNPERDIAGYEVYREPVGGETGPQKVCALTTETSCYDSDPPSAGTYSSLQYYVLAQDGGGRTTKSVDATVSQATNARPSPPGSLTLSTVDGYPTLNWTAASDSDGTIQFYRIYRDGSALDHRYDVTGGPTLSYTDRTTVTTHSYWVTAVDDKFNESDPVGPVTP